MIEAMTKTAEEKWHEYKQSIFNGNARLSSTNNGV